MDMTPERNDNTENSEDRELGSPTPSESPSPPHADLNEWVMQGLNQLNERFNRIEGRLDEIGKDVGDLKERVARVEEKITSIPQIEKKLWSLQRNMWVATGILIVIVFLARIFLPDFDITITPK